MAKSLHILMFSHFAMGHLTAFLHLANELARRGHRISFLLPPKAISKLSHFNLHPHFIIFTPITVPCVDGLPVGAQITSDVPISQGTLIVTAMDRTKTEIEAKLIQLKPQFVFFDFAYWMPELTQRLGIKSIHYSTISSACLAYSLVPIRDEEYKNPESQGNVMEQQPAGFPSSSVKLKKYEASRTHFFKQLEFGEGITFHDRNMKSLRDCDAIAVKSCREMEGGFCDYIQRQFGKPVLLTGPGLPSEPTDSLEDRWVNWLNKFDKNSVVYVSFGSEYRLKKDQLEELLLGLELMGSPFLTALKAPLGVDNIEDALPDGFRERVGERGVVYGEWVQQQLLLQHTSIGCFVTHCGSGSLSEALVSRLQIVMLPTAGDQFINARLMGGDLKVGVEVERRDEDGWYTKENVCEAVKLVMDEKSEVGKEVRANHDKWRAFLLSEGLQTSYIEGFIKSMVDMLG